MLETKETLSARKNGKFCEIHDLLFDLFQHSAKRHGPKRINFFFFQAEDGIRDTSVTGSDVCSSDLEVEIEQAVGAFTADGVEYPKGSYVVRVAQPFGAFAKTMMEKQVYPDLREYPGGPPQRP